jgi:hypothetical protein
MLVLAAVTATPSALPTLVRHQSSHGLSKGHDGQITPLLDRVDDVGESVRYTIEQALDHIFIINLLT